MLVFTAERLLTPTAVVERALLLVEHGRIVDVASRGSRELPIGARSSDFGDVLIAPGYFDLHIHGNAGFDVMDDTADALPAIELLLAKHGVTSYFPTTVTAPEDVTLRALDRLGDVIENAGRADREGRAVAAGIHLEGPFISHARRGVHPPDNLIKPTLAMFDKFWQAARGRIRMMTIAPELEGALEVISEAARRGVCVSLGHSDADFAATERGIASLNTVLYRTFLCPQILCTRTPRSPAASSPTASPRTVLSDAITLLRDNGQGPVADWLEAIPDWKIK